MKSFGEKHVRNKFMIISFLCSILVIFIHTNNLETYQITMIHEGWGGIANSLETYVGKITGIAVPAFFLLSGILFFRTFEPTKLLQKWKSRIFTLLIPYVIWCSVYYFYYVFLSRIPIVASIMNDKSKIDLSVSEWINRIIFNQYYTLWFLKSLICLVLLTPIIWLLLKNHVNRIPTGLVVLICIIVVTSKLEGVAWGHELYYLVGAYIGINHRKYLLVGNKWLSVSGGCIVLVQLLTSLISVNMVSVLLFLFSLWYLLDFLNLEEKKLPWWMSISFFTYVSHDIILEALEKIFLKAMGVSPIMAILDYCLMPFLTFGVVVLVANILRGATPTLWKIITGNR